MARFQIAENCKYRLYKRNEEFPADFDEFETYRFLGEKYAHELPVFDVLENVDGKRQRVLIDYKHRDYKAIFTAYGYYLKRATDHDSRSLNITELMIPSI